MEFSVFSDCAQNLFKEFSKIFVSAPVVLCVGNPCFEEDLLGPLVGSTLKKLGYKNEVYGTMQNPICANNLFLAQKFVKKIHVGQKILVVDASTSQNHERLGKIVLKKNYVPFNPNLKNTKLKADFFLFGVSSVCGQIFPQMFYAKTLLVQKIANLISKSLALF